MLCDANLETAGQVELIATSIAAPIYGADDTVVAALSIVIPSAGASPQMYVPAVRTAARGVSMTLGASSVRSGRIAPNGPG